jgi:hypothetical protein
MPRQSPSSVLTKRAQDTMFAGSHPRFSGTHLASFAPSVRKNRRRSQVWRVMFARPYREQRLARAFDNIYGLPALGQFQKFTHVL